MEDRTKNKQQKNPAQRCVGIIAVLMMLGSFIFFKETSEPEAVERNNVVGGKTEPKVAKGMCEGLCAARKEQLRRHFNGDLLDTKDLVRLTESAQERMVKRLHEMYGKESYDKMFEGQEASWRKAFKSGAAGLSVGRFHRKMQMKVLEAQIEMAEESLEGCSCNHQSPANSERVRRGLQETKIILPPPPDFYNRFVWATGGHSAAASHGNLHNESYTFYMETLASDVFRSVGIELEGRNYAMGGMRSGPELALCQEAVYGMDADVITWDFGMTDGNSIEKLYWYINRIGVHRNRPAFVNLGPGGRAFKGRVMAGSEGEETGLTTFFADPGVRGLIDTEIPDMADLTQEQIDELPPFVKYIKCQQKMEGGEPNCGQEKYNLSICPKRKSRVSWHPGWRVQAITGALMAHFMVGSLVDALRALDKDVEAGTSPREHLQRLKAQEDKDYAAFMSSPIQLDWVSKIIDAEVQKEVPIEVLMRNPVVCHTGLLPSQSRYLGILTDTKEIGDPDKDDYGFYKGLSTVEADKIPANSLGEERQMNLVYDLRERQAECPIHLEIDFKDFFYTRQSDEWTSLTVPNDAELAVYGYDGKVSSKDGKNVLMMCLLLCDWGKCPKGDLREDSLPNGDMLMEVNGLKVSNWTQVIGNCLLLRHEEGYRFQQNEAGRFVFRAKAVTPNSMIRITSLMVL